MYPDAYDQWAAMDEREARFRSGRPACHFCGEPILSMTGYASRDRLICPYCYEHYYSEEEQEEFTEVMIDE